MNKVYNRDILFRGKQVSNDDWIEGYVFSQCIDGGYVPLCIATEPICANDYSEILGDWAVVDSSTVGQYTGLTDKNDKKIFEWDIIKVPDCCHRGDAVGFVYYDCDETAYCAKCWGIKYQLGADLSSDSIEIIGNIHDNPELLEECK